MTSSVSSPPSQPFAGIELGGTKCVAILAHGTERELRPMRGANPLRHPYRERRPERAGDFRGDEHAAARNTDDSHLAAIADVAEKRQKLPPSLGAILQHQVFLLFPFPGLKIEARGPGGMPLFVARTGYTGEDGFEIIVPEEHAAALWTALAAAGVHPAGLGTRDTLRLEAGMNLYGQDMDEGITPWEAGLAWTVPAGSAAAIMSASGAASAIFAMAVPSSRLLWAGILSARSREDALLATNRQLA